MKVSNALTSNDINLLRAAGFVPSQSAASWFGVDRVGKEWQAMEDDDTGMLLLRGLKELGTNTFRPMSREDFNATFSYRT